MSLVDITESTPYTLKQARVYSSPALKDFVWTAVPWLQVEKLALVCGPEISRAEMSHKVGFFPIRNDSPHSSVSPITGTAVDFLDLNRKYCKVEIFGDDDGAVFTWYGIFEVDARDTSVFVETEVETGNQTLLAYGLERELEKTFVTSSKVADYTGGGYRTINRGLPFNYVQRAGGLVLRGNKDSGSTLAFSDNPLGPQKWNASGAIKYLFENNSPEGASGAEHCVWELGGEVISWYDISVDTDRRSVKSIIDELVDRRKLAGYWCEGYVDGDDIKGRLNCFTFAQSDITEGVDTIPANTDQIQLGCGDKPYVAERVLRNDVQHVADRVRVEGNWITSTFSLEWEDLVIGWTSTLETGYLAAAGGADADANTIARAQDKWRDVFARFLVDPEWDRVCRGGSFMTIDPSTIPDDIEDADVVTLFNSASATESELLFRWKRFHEYLAIKDSDTDEFRRPFVLFPNGGDTYCFAEQASLGDRNFACNVHMLHDTLGVKLHVNKSGGQSLLAAGHWTGANDAPAELDPDDTSNLAFNYEDQIITATVEWDDRVYAEKVINTPLAHERLQLIRLPDARLDFELDSTVTDLSDAGDLVVSDGKVLRDDRARMRSIAAAAAQWYGVERNALTVVYDSTTPFVALGQLVTELQDGDLDPIEVNTAITGILYDFGSGKTSIETSYADVDFGGLAS